MTDSNINGLEASNARIEATLKAMTPDVYQQFLRAIETGRWPNGDLLSAEQRATCMEAIIIYEHKHVDKSQRTGFVPPKKTPCDTHEPADEAIRWES